MDKITELNPFLDRALDILCAAETLIELVGTRHKGDVSGAIYCNDLMTIQFSMVLKLESEFNVKFDYKEDVEADFRATLSVIDSDSANEVLRTIELERKDRIWTWEDM